MCLVGVVVRRYIDFLMLLISLLLLYLLFFAAASLLFVNFLKCFSFLFQNFLVIKFYVYDVNISGFKCEVKRLRFSK